MTSAGVEGTHESILDGSPDAGWIVGLTRALLRSQRTRLCLVCRRHSCSLDALADGCVGSHVVPSLGRSHLRSDLFEVSGGEIMKGIVRGSPEAVENARLSRRKRVV